VPRGPSLSQVFIRAPATPTIFSPCAEKTLGRVFKVARLEKTVDVDVYVDELVEVGVAWPIEV